MASCTAGERGEREQTFPNHADACSPSGAAPVAAGSAESSILKYGIKWRLCGWCQAEMGAELCPPGRRRQGDA